MKTWKVRLWSFNGRTNQLGVMAEFVVEAANKLEARWKGLANLRCSPQALMGETVEKVTISRVSQ